MTPMLIRPVAARTGLRLAIATLIAMSSLAGPVSADHLAPIRAQISAQHDANVQRLKDWIALPNWPKSV